MRGSPDLAWLGSQPDTLPSERNSIIVTLFNPARNLLGSPRPMVSGPAGDAHPPGNPLDLARPSHSEGQRDPPVPMLSEAERALSRRAEPSGRATRAPQFQRFHEALLAVRTWLNNRKCRENKHFPWVWPGNHAGGGRRNHNQSLSPGEEGPRVSPKTGDETLWRPFIPASKGVTRSYPFVPKGVNLTLAKVSGGVTSSRDTFSLPGKRAENWRARTARWVDLVAHPSSEGAWEARS